MRHLHYLFFLHKAQHVVNGKQPHRDSEQSPLDHLQPFPAKIALIVGTYDSTNFRQGPCNLACAH